MSVALVTSIKADLIARGVIPVPQTTNEHAFAITARVAWALRVAGARLIVKTSSQNGAVYNGVKYSHDAIAFDTGWIDCLASAGPPVNVNQAVWQRIERSDAPLVDPFDLDAGTTEPAEPTEPAPDVPPPPTDDVVTALGVVAIELQRLRAELQKVIDTGTLDKTTIVDQLGAIRATQALGLRNRYLGALTVPDK